jgi:hypothetical protein
MSNYKTGDSLMDRFLAQIEQGTIPAQTIINKILELTDSLKEKDRQVDQVNKSFAQFHDVNRKIDEIHKLHFCREEMLERGEKNKISQKDKFMAQILLGRVRKRKK